VGAAVGDAVSEMRRIVAFVREEGFADRCGVEKRGCDGDVGDIAGAEPEGP
jgi:hypothetical protein